MAILIILLLIAAIVLVVKLRIMEVLASYRWQAFTARVSGVELFVEQNEDDGFFVQPTVFFEYDIRQETTSLQHNYRYAHYFAMDHEGDTSRFFERFKIGQKISVFVSTEDPEQVRLSRGPARMEKLAVFCFLG